MTLASRPPQVGRARLRMPSAYPEAVLLEPAVAWVQLLRGDAWEPMSVEVTALHVDGGGVRVACPTSIGRGTRLVMNLTLVPPDSMHMQGIVKSTRKSGKKTSAVVRFENQTDADRDAIVQYVGRLERPPEDPFNNSEQRRYHRFVKSVSVRYQRLEDDGSIAPGQGQMVTLDIGGGGMKFRVDKDLKVGDLLYVHLPIDVVPFFSLGEVVWVDESRVEGRYVAGLKFIDLSESERRRLIKLITAC